MDLESDLKLANMVGHLTLDFGISDKSLCGHSQPLTTLTGGSNGRRSK